MFVQCGVYIVRVNVQYLEHSSAIIKTLYQEHFRQFSSKIFEDRKEKFVLESLFNPIKDHSFAVPISLHFLSPGHKEKLNRVQFVMEKLARDFKRTCPT